MTEKEMREIEMQEIGKRLEKIGPKLNGSLTEKELIQNHGKVNFYGK